MSDKDYRVFYDNYMKTNAATEATGLIYCAADSGEEWNAYRDIFDFEPICHHIPGILTKITEEIKKD